MLLFCKEDNIKNQAHFVIDLWLKSLAQDHCLVSWVISKLSFLWVPYKWLPAPPAPVGLHFFDCMLSLVLYTWLDVPCFTICSSMYCLV